MNLYESYHGSLPHFMSWKEVYILKGVVPCHRGIVFIPVFSSLGGIENHDASWQLTASEIAGIMIPDNC